MKSTIEKLKQFKHSKKIPMLTAYDFPTALAALECGIDIVLVGDSVGAAVLGYEDVSQVTMPDMIHHVGAVGRAAGDMFVLADLPFRSYETAQQALENARKLIDCKADGVKIEGQAEVAETVALLTRRGIPVCAHIGYTPQTIEKPSVQGKDVLRAQELILSAIALERSGAFMIVLELVTEQVAAEITRLLKIPTIGIGSGPHCDGQVLVINDMIGLSVKTFKHVKTFGSAREELKKSICGYAGEVGEGRFPTSANATSMAPDIFAQVKEWVDKEGYRRGE
jgi:3-methyl-2-oxobutanoate hydroxymethyltransferase